jgi:hypothetical protein
MYHPNSWVMVEIPNLDTMATGPIYKILGGWTGSYVEGSSWRLNSGIDSVKVEDNGDPEDTEYYFHGASGSVYHCWRQLYGIKFATSGIAEQLTSRGCKILTEEEMVLVLNDKFNVQQTV